MDNSIKLPDKVRVGYQSRSDTYTKSLAYIIYYDEKGKLRKETSWEGWRDKKIEPNDYDNVPTEGFVLNKKAGGYDSGWNHRQTYCRVYDPRGFEFEITIPNLLYILENTNSIKGKGLEGEFVYGWSGKELVLIPVSSPDYEELNKYNNIIKQKDYIKAKDLKIGATYLKKNNTSVVYMGKFNKYEYENRVYKYNDYLNDYHNLTVKNEGLMHYFVLINDKNEVCGFETHKSISQKFISCLSEECHNNYADFISYLEKSSKYSPYDKSKDQFIPYTLEEFKNCYLDSQSFYTLTNKNEIEIIRFKTTHDRYDPKTGEYLINKYGVADKDKMFSSYVGDVFDNIEDLFNKYQPQYKFMYLENGNFYKKVSNPNIYY